MEKKLEEDIRKFLSIGDGSGYGSGYGSGSGSGSGYGDGYGDGSGDGDGDGDGYGYGDGSGDGYGSGYGSGDGYGYGDGITQFNGKKVYQIDGVPTLIDSVHGNVAKGHILQSDFTLTPCYVAKADNCFAHGDTVRDAMRDAADKALEKLPLEDRIEKFRSEHPDPDRKVEASELYEWHHVLTGSCATGRNAFARDHGINIDTDTFTVREFISLTCNAYGSDAIRKLAEAYGIVINK